MASDPTKRLENWDKKFDTERIKAILDAKRSTMLERLAAVLPSLVSMEAQVKQVLDGQGASTIQYPFYLCFGREMWKYQHQQELSGASYAKAAQVLINKWVGRGLTQSILEKIRDDVFSIGAPAGP